jgi:hypothetical protein
MGGPFWHRTTDPRPAGSRVCDRVRPVVIIVVTINEVDATVDGASAEVDLITR